MSERHFINSIRKSLREKIYDNSYKFSNQGEYILKKVYDLEIEHGEELTNKGYKTPSYCAWSVLMGFKTELFKTKEELLFRWIEELIEELFGTYDDNERDDVLPRHLSYRDITYNPNPYHGVWFVDKYDFMERSESPMTEMICETDGLHKGILSEFKELAQTLFKSPGVYMFYNRNKELIYIGKSINLSQRLIGSALEKETAMYATVKETKTYADCGIYEMYYIGLYKPKLNSDGMTDDYPTFELPELGSVAEMIQIRDS